jgi:type IV pilus assembly protein PilB
MLRDEYNRLGQLLIRSGAINIGQLALALEQQKNTQQKLGEVMIAQGFVSQADVDAALEAQSRVSFTTADAGPRPHA